MITTPFRGNISHVTRDVKRAAYFLRKGKNRNGPSIAITTKKRGRHEIMPACTYLGSRLLFMELDADVDPRQHLAPVMKGVNPLGLSGIKPRSEAVRQKNQREIPGGVDP